MANAAQSTCFKEIHHDLYGVYSPDNRNSLEQIATRIDAISYVLSATGDLPKLSPDEKNLIKSLPPKTILITIDKRFQSPQKENRDPGDDASYGIAEQAIQRCLLQMYSFYSLQTSLGAHHNFEYCIHFKHTNQRDPIGRAHYSAWVHGNEL